MDDDAEDVAKEADGGAAFVLFLNEAAALVSSSSELSESELSEEPSYNGFGFLFAGGAELALSERLRFLETGADVCSSSLLSLLLSLLSLEGIVLDGSAVRATVGVTGAGSASSSLESLESLLTSAAALEAALGAGLGAADVKNVVHVDVKDIKDAEEADDADDADDEDDEDDADNADGADDVDDADDVEDADAEDNKDCL